ncbi:hypothetical protein ACFSHP_24335 [Novosphingobium panipatense]
MTIRASLLPTEVQAEFFADLEAAAGIAPDLTSRSPEPVGAARRAVTVSPSL